MKLKTFIVISILLNLSFIGYAQSPYGSDVVEVAVEKVGQLEKNLKKVNALNTKKLSIIGSNRDYGVLTTKDLTFLSGLSQLEELYIDADVSIFFMRDKFIKKTGILSNENFPNLKKIGLGLHSRHGIADLFNLKVQGYVVGAGENYFPESINFEDVYIVTMPECDNSNGFLASDNKSWLVESSNGSWRLDHKKKIHSIHVNARDWLASSICNNLNPAVIYIHAEMGDEKYLSNYQSLLYEEDKDLTQYDEILPGALTDSSFDILRLPDKQKSINDNFFENVTVNKLDLNQIKTIGKNAFAGTHIKEIHLPATVQNISGHAFDDSEISLVYMDGEYAPSIDGNPNYENIRFVIPKGSRQNYQLGAWKELRVLEDGATTNFTIDVKEPGTFATFLTDDVREDVVSLKLCGVFYSDDFKLLEDCPNLTSLDLSETFIAQSPKELKEQQEMSKRWAGVIMNMGVNAHRAKHKYDRMSPEANKEGQFLAKLRERLKNYKVTSDSNCQIPNLKDTHIEELILPLQLKRVDYRVYSKRLKKIVLPPNLKEFSIYPHPTLTEIILPASVQSVEVIRDDYRHYNNLRLIDMSACKNPSIEIGGYFDNPLTIKFPETYTKLSVDINGYYPVKAYFKSRELSGDFYGGNPQKSTIYIPKGSRAGYSCIISSGYNVVEQ